MKLESEFARKATRWNGVQIRRHLRARCQITAFLHFLTPRQARTPRGWTYPAWKCPGGTLAA
jgi:hypothetical protein